MSPPFVNFPIPTVPFDPNALLVTATGSTTARSLANRFADTNARNAKNFGVVADGVTDDTTAINAAITAGDGIVDLNPGTYGLVGGANFISMAHNNVWLRGSGKGATVLKLLNAGATDIIRIIAGGALSNCGLSDLTIDMGSFLTNFKAVFAQSVDNFFCRRVSVINAGNGGISGQGLTNFDISDNDVTRNVATGANQNNGIILFSSIQNTNGTISRNHCTKMNIELDGTELRISDNRVQDWKYGGGIVMGPSLNSHDNIVAHNICTGGTGVDVDGTHVGGLELFTARTLVVGNVCSGNSGHGILLGGDSMTCVGNLSFNNGVTGVDSAGIFIQDGGAQIGTNSVVVGNRCYGQNYGVAANAVVTNYMVRDNVLYGNNIGDTDLNVAANIGSTQFGTTYTVKVSDRYLSFTNAGTITLTLPTAVSCPRRSLCVRGTGGGALVSASSNVVPLAGGAAGTAILAAAAGKWAWLQSDGTNWVILAGN